MNKKIVYFLMLALSVSLFSACNDDDDDNKTEDYAQQIAATYNGDLTVKIGENAVPAIKKDIKVSRTDVNKAKVEVDELNMPVFDKDGKPAIGENGNVITTDIKNIVIDNIAVAKSGNEIKLAETSKELEIDVEGVKVKITVKVSGSHVDNKLKLEIGVTGTPAGNVTATFEGAKK